MLLWTLALELKKNGCTTVLQKFQIEETLGPRSDGILSGVVYLVLSVQNMQHPTMACRKRSLFEMHSPAVFFVQYPQAYIDMHIIYIVG